MYRLVSVFLAVLMVGVCSVDAGAHPSPAATKVIVTYYHGTNRCYTCRKIEAVSRAAVEKAFAAKISAGEVVFRTVNFDLPENSNIIKEYSLVSQSLILARESDGKVVRWSNLDKIWRLARDEDALADYVVESVEAYLADQ